jgi:hydroxylamine reductase (hybrid-cluster protein)
MGLCCSACSQGPCRLNPFDPSNGTTCGRDREGIVAANFLRTVVDGAAAQAAFAGAESRVAGIVFEGLAAASEGNLGAAPLLAKALDVASAGLDALSSAGASSAVVRQTSAGLGAARADKINLLLLGGLRAEQARQIARQLASDVRVNLIGAAGGEVAEVAMAAGYGSQEALLATTAVDGVVAGRACVSPGFLALAARHGVPVVDADGFQAAALLDRAEAHFRLNQGRNLARQFAPARATVGFDAAAFDSLSPSRWDSLTASGLRGLALLGGCNNVKDTQDAGIVRQAAEFLKNDVLVIATGCAAAALARAGYMDPARREAFAGRGLSSFLAALSEASGLTVPAVLEAGTCWELPRALELADLFQRRLRLPMAAALPEVSRPAGWSTALALAARGVPTYVGPVVPLDGSLEGMNTLNALLKSRGGAFVGPGQVQTPEAVVRLVMSDEY